MIVNVNLQLPPAGTTAPVRLNCVELLATIFPPQTELNPLALKPGGMFTNKPAGASTVPALVKVSVAASILDTDGLFDARLRLAL